MRRMQINTIMVDALDFFSVRLISLPPFATWTVADFVSKVSDHGCAAIVRRGLGWMVTDFGLDDFAKEGMVTFTTRSGKQRECTDGNDNQYAETHLILRDGQRMPFVYHCAKTKDIINRGSGTLLVRMFHALATGEHDETRMLQVNVDGQRRELVPGEAVALRAGESMTVASSVYHEYSASGQDILATEIATSSNIINDVFFYDPLAVALEIDEDEQPRHLLVQDYREHFTQLDNDS